MFTFVLKRRRPAWWTALAFGTGLVLAKWVGWGVWPCLVAALTLWGVALGVAWSGWGGSALHSVLFLGLAVALGSLRYLGETQVLPDDHIEGLKLWGQRLVLGGRVVSEPVVLEGRTQFVLALDQAAGPDFSRSVSGRVQVSVRRVALQVGAGDRLVLHGRLRRPTTGRNPGAFNRAQALALVGISGLCTVGKEEQVLAVEVAAPSWAAQVFGAVRRHMRASIRRHLEGEPAALLEGLLLGEKHRIPAAVAENFRRAGLAHVLVVSGLHTGLVAAFFWVGFKLMRLSDGAAVLAALLALAVYAGAAHFQLPVVRAAIMLAILFGGRILGRRADVYNSVGLAALVIWACWPGSVWSLSFQLSFAAVLGIVRLHRPLLECFPVLPAGIRRWLVEPLCVSLAAQLATGPLVAAHFQQIAPIGLLANLVAVPLLSLSVGLGLSAAILGGVLPWAGTAFSACNWVALKGLLVVSGFCAGLPGAGVAVAKPGWAFWGLAWVGFFLAPYLREGVWARKALLFAGLLAGNWAVFGPLLQPARLEVVFFDVGQGDAAFVRLPNGRTLVVDGGQRSPEYDNGARVLLPFLRQRGIDRIDGVIASHPHSDHIGGLIALLEEVEVGLYIDGGQACESWTCRRLEQLRAEKGIAYRAVAAGDTLAGLGAVRGAVLHPRASFVDGAGPAPLGANNGSVTLRLSYGEMDFLFSGDVEYPCDGALLSWGEGLGAEVLKVPHHGSGTSSRQRFVAAVRPRIALVSVGAFNRFGHPNPAVIARLRAQGAQVYRTDRCGALTVRSDGAALAVETAVEGCRQD